MADVLICYTQNDRDAARACGEYLAAAGFDVLSDAPAAGRSRLRGGSSSAAREAVAVVAIASAGSLRSRQVREEIDVAAAVCRLVVASADGLDPQQIPSDVLPFHVGPVADHEQIAQALHALGIESKAVDDQGFTPTAPPREDSVREMQAWTFVDRRGDPRLIQKFLEHFPEGEHAAAARGRVGELAGVDAPDGDTRRPMLVLAGVVLLGAVSGLAIAKLLPQRAMVRIDIAAGGGSDAYLRMVSRYNEHLQPFGVELVPHQDAKSAFGNVRLLAEGKVQAAFVKGGFAGALRDPEYLTEARVKNRGKDWEHNWSAKLDNFMSLGRLSLEPLWVFTFGASERHQLSELDGEPINIGSMESGGRTLATLLLEKNKVRFRSDMWLGTELPNPKSGDRKPLGEARALFVQQPAEAPRVQALLQNLAGEKHFDKTRDIKTAAFSPRGRRILVVLGDQTVRVLDATTGREVAILKGHTEAVNDAAFSPDGARIVTGSDDDTIRVWDATTGAPIGAPIQGSGKDINGVAFSPDGKRIVSASESDRATIRDAATGKALVYLEGKGDVEGHFDDVNSAVFSPDGTKVVTASRDGTARIWDATTGDQLAVLNGHAEAVQSAVFSNNGNLVATASWDNTARLWDAKTGQLKLILKGHEDIVKAVDFSPDDKLLITGSWDDSGRIWDVATGQEIRKINGLQSNVNGVGFSPDGKLAMTASQDSTVRLWEVGTWAKVADYNANPASALDQHANARKLHLMDFNQDADAYINRFPFLSKVQLPKGAIDFEPHVPANTVTLLATTLALVVDKAWAEKNPSLVRVLTDAVVHKPQTGLDEVSRKPRLFFRSGQFPTLNDPEYEVAPQAVPVYRSGDVPFVLHRLARLRFMPFGWAAWLDEHAGTLVLSLIPLLGILIPLIRFVPALYNWTVRRRILYWYRRLQALEGRLDIEERAAHPERSAPEIDRIDAAVSKIRVPLNYSDQYYDLRAHIDLVRQRLLSRISQANGAAASANGKVKPATPSPT